jgi:hypothetical protein
MILLFSHKQWYFPFYWSIWNNYVFLCGSEVQMFHTFLMKKKWGTKFIPYLLWHYATDIYHEKMRTSYYTPVLIKKILLLDILLRFITVIQYYSPSATKSPIHNQLLHLPAHKQFDFNELSWNCNYGRGIFSWKFQTSRNKPFHFPTEFPHRHKPTLKDSS